MARRSRPGLKLLIGSAACLMLAVVVAVPVTLRFIFKAFPSVTSPIAEWDEGQTRRVEGLEPGVRLKLCIVLESLEDEAPALDVTVRGGDGEAVETEPSQGWATMLGRHYRWVLTIAPPPGGALEIRVDAEPADGTADFALFRHPDDVMSREVASALPGWVASGLLVLGAFAFFVCAALAQRSDGSQPPEA